MTRQGPGWQVSTTQGVLAAGEVLVATSGYTGPVSSSLCRKLLPIGSYIIATEPLAKHWRTNLAHARG